MNTSLPQAVLPCSKAPMRLEPEPQLCWAHRRTAARAPGDGRSFLLPLVWGRGAGSPAGSPAVLSALTTDMSPQKESPGFYCKSDQTPLRPRALRSHKALESPRDPLSAHFARALTEAQLWALASPQLCSGGAALQPHVLGGHWGSAVGTLLLPYVGPALSGVMEWFGWDRTFTPILLHTPAMGSTGTRVAGLGLRAAARKGGGGRGRGEGGGGSGGGGSSSWQLLLALAPV